MRLEASIAQTVARLRAPLVTSAGVFRDRPGMFLWIRVHDGRFGRGEATPLVEFGTEDLDATRVALERTCQALTSRAPPATLDEVRSLVSELELQRAPAARHAVECALLDVVAQGRGKPLCELLAEEAGRGSALRAVRVNALLPARGPEAVADEAARAREEGYATVKLKVGMADDLARASAVRRALGAEPKLRLDANGAWSPEQAVRALEELTPCSPELCEQPVPAKDIRGLRWVAQHARIPVAADEALADPDAAAALLEPPPLHALAIKPMVCGGLLAGVDLALAAWKAGAHVYVTSGLEGPVGRMAALHLAAAIDDGHAHGLAIASLLEPSPGEEQLLPRRGEIPVPFAPGLGLR